MNIDKGICHLLRGSFHDMLEALQEEYDSVCKDKEGLLNVIDTWNKDTELQKLRVEVDYYRRHSLCQLSDKEMAAIKIICPCCEAEENVTDYDTW